MKFKNALIFALVLVTRPIMGGDLSKKCYHKISHLEYDASEMEVFAVGTSYNLSDSNCSRILFKKLCREEAQELGENAPHAVLHTLLRIQPENTFEWILDHYQEFNGEARSSIAVALRNINFQESYKLLQILLMDKTEIIDNRAAVLAPGHYWNVRVCDLAYDSLLSALPKDTSSNSDLPRALHSSISVDVRDKSIKRLLEWWGQSSESVTRNKTTLAGNRPSIGNKMWAFERRRK